MAERTIRRCSDLKELAIDRRGWDNGQSRGKWCEALGLDAMDVGRTADAQFDERLKSYVARVDAGEIDDEVALRRAIRDTFLYGLLLGRELGP